MAKKIYTSSVPRANETWKEVAKEINLNAKESIDVEVRSKLWFFNTEYYPEEIAEEFMYWKNQGLTEEELVSNFLDWKRESQPEDLAKNFLFDMSKIFERVIRSWDSLKIIAFRHWEKDKEWQLTDHWYEQARELGRTLGEQRDATDNTIYIATHNTINESIFTTLFGRENLPVEWLSPIWFTEPVEYVFIPWVGWVGFLTISLRGKILWMSSESFREVVENL